MSSVVCPFCTIVAQKDSNVREVYRDDDVTFFPTEHSRFRRGKPD